jgi:penicillin-binding protein 1B
MILGGLIAGFFLWSRATRDVDAFLLHPPTQQPSIIFSAPVQLLQGQAYETTDLRTDLMAAGYEQVQTLARADQFTVHDGRFHVWTKAYAIPGKQYPSNQVRFTIQSDKVQLGGNKPVVLKPTVLAVIGDLNTRRTPTSLSNISPMLREAVLGMEDSRFREHGGIDPLGIARAIVHNVLSSKSSHGGSTITQQLAKNLFLSQSRTMQRKVREAFFAAALESRLSKDQILELYLNEIYLGQTGSVPIHGVESAARAWFGISANQLNLEQAALIAAVVAAPNAYSPLRHPERALKRRNVVLTRLHTLNKISDVQLAKAEAAPITLNPNLGGLIRQAPWAVDAAVEGLEEQFGTQTLAVSGLHVHTTIQPHLQRAAQWALTGQLDRLENQHVKAKGVEGALISVSNADGSVLAMVGGRDYYKSPFNRAAHASRQGGSISKPLLLLSAFDHDSSLGPASLVSDAPIERRNGGRVWKPSNSDKQFMGDITIRTAIEKSRNIPAVLLAEKVGLSTLQSDYRRIGLEKATALPSAALGAFDVTPIQAAGAYTIFPNSGVYRQPRLITGVMSGSGKTIVHHKPKSKRVAKESSAVMATAIMQGVMTNGTARNAASLGIGDLAAGKTGTTDDFRDAWFAGFTPTTSTVVWVGKDKNGSIGLSGASAALPVWAAYVNSAAAERGAFDQPQDAQYHSICADSGQLSTPRCPNVYDEIFWSTQSTPNTCSHHSHNQWSIGQLFRGWFSKREKTKPVTAN